MGETWDGALRTLEPAGTLGMQAEPFLLLMWKLRPRGGRELTQDHVGVSLRVSPGDSGLRLQIQCSVFFYYSTLEHLWAGGRGKGRGLEECPLWEKRGHVLASIPAWGPCVLAVLLPPSPWPCWSHCTLSGPRHEGAGPGESWSSSGSEPESPC